MNPAFVAALRCPACRGDLTLLAGATVPSGVAEGELRCSCGRRFPVIAAIPRLLPDDLAPTLLAEQPEFFRRHPDLSPPTGAASRPASLSTLQAFGDEWRRFPEIHEVHERIFNWYFEGPKKLEWNGLRVLDAGCGMGRWLHFAQRAGASVVGMDVSPAVDVVASREVADLVQADLRSPPFAPGSFDLVYCLGVIHHLEDPLRGLEALAELVRPAGELRIYVYRSLEGEGWPRRALLATVTAVRQVTTRLPYWSVHMVATALAALATVILLLPRRLLRGWRRGDRLTKDLPLAHYADVPFRMLVAEQFDRLVAPLEGRYGADEIKAWFGAIGFELVSLQPGLGWRAIARRPSAEGLDPKATSCPRPQG